MGTAGNRQGAVKVPNGPPVPSRQWASPTRSRRGAPGGQPWMERLDARRNRKCERWRTLDDFDASLGDSVVAVDEPDR